MFAKGALAREVETATVVLANPPFEREQAATFLHRVVQALRPGTVFGFVLPVNELSGAASAAVRRKLLADCEIKEISVFPDRMFKFASVETGIVLGRKHEAKRTVVSSGIMFRRVRESKMDDFRERYDDSWRDKVDAEWLASTNQTRFVVPELRRVRDYCKQFSQIRNDASIVQGIIHHTSNHPDFPKGAITESEEKISGLVLGFSGMTNAPETHLTPRTKWLNLDRRVVRFASSATGTPQVLLNYAPVDRDVWRLKAYIDPLGYPATSRMLRIHPKSPDLPLVCLWALCNSPFANAYTYSWASKRDIPAGLMRGMPVPNLNVCDLSPLATASRVYLNAANGSPRVVQKASARTKSRSNRKRDFNPDERVNCQLGLPGQHTDEEIVAAREHLRALHWRVDAEVLRLYALPPELERELLDSFDGVRRVGVPFEQTRYIPREFRDVLTLDEFLRITDEWDATEKRRCELIEKRIKSGRRNLEEEAAFQQLQRLLTLRRRFYSPLPTAEIKALTKQLREGRTWPDDD